MMRRDPVEIIEDNPESIKAFHDRGWGSSEWYITQEQLQQLKDGKLIALSDGEYTHVIALGNK